jgi:prepilin-type N-terminal cleavage/methylation domain-containing protein
MNCAESHELGPVPARSRRRAGVTLIEVLVAIFIMGIGLLALLVLFPLGAIEMSQAIQDDRTAAFADRAIALGDAGEELVANTLDFASFSKSQGSANPQVAGMLRQGYLELAAEAQELEVELTELQSVFPQPSAQQYFAQLLAQIRLIQFRIGFLVKLLLYLENLPP